MSKCMFTISIMYFSHSDYPYTAASINEEFDAMPGDFCPMFDVINLIRQMQSQRRLPGIRLGEWDGPILVDCVQGYKYLILPDRKVQESANEDQAQV